MLPCASKPCPRHIDDPEAIGCRDLSPEEIATLYQDALVLESLASSMPLAGRVARRARALADQHARAVHKLGLEVLARTGEIERRRADTDARALAERQRSDVPAELSPILRAGISLLLLGHLLNKGEGAAQAERVDQARRAAGEALQAAGFSPPSDGAPASTRTPRAPGAPTEPLSFEEAWGRPASPWAPREIREEEAPPVPPRPAPAKPTEPLDVLGARVEWRLNLLAAALMDARGDEAAIPAYIKARAEALGALEALRLGAETGSALHGGAAGLLFALRCEEATPDGLKRLGARLAGLAKIQNPGRVLSTRPEDTIPATPDVKGQRKPSRAARRAGRGRR